MLVARLPGFAVSQQRLAAAERGLRAFCTPSMECTVRRSSSALGRDGGSCHAGGCSSRDFDERCVTRNHALGQFGKGGALDARYGCWHAIRARKANAAALRTSRDMASLKPGSWHIALRGSDTCQRRRDVWLLRALHYPVGRRCASRPPANWPCT